jgi:hypothetical protein
MTRKCMILKILFWFRLVFVETKFRPEIPEEKIIQVQNNTKKIDFSKPFKFIYLDFWFDLLTFPFFILCILAAGCCSFFSGFVLKAVRIERY